MDIPSAAELSLENEALLEFMYLCPFGLLQLDADGAVELANPVAAQLLMPIARTPAIANLFGVLEGAAPDLRSLVDSFREPQGNICDNRRVFVDQQANGDQQVLSLTVIKIEPGRLMAVLNDVSREVAQERRLKQADSWFSAMLSGVNDFALVALDQNGRVVSWTETAEGQTGFTAADMAGRTLATLYLPDEAVQGRPVQQIDMSRRDGWHIDEGWRRRKDGTRYWCQSLVAVMEKTNHEISGFSVVLRDVGAEAREVEKIRELVTTDHLTGVLNRAHFHELAAAEVERARRSGTPLCALMVDVDHFKSINDTYGHAAGDMVLRELAATLRRYLRTTDLLGRLGGEEFAIMLPGLDAEAGKLISVSLHSQLRLMHLPLRGKDLKVTVSIGCAQVTSAVDTLPRLLDASDQALYEAKRLGRNRTVVYVAGPELRAVS